jgi:hypothetical protein
MDPSVRQSGCQRWAESDGHASLQDPGIARVAGRLTSGTVRDESCWISENRTHFFGGDEGDDAAGYDFLVKTPKAVWLYEVKSSLEDTGEFELTANQLRVAGTASKDGRRRYRVLYVPYVFSPDKWFVLELPNPMGERTRNQFETVGRGSVRLRFERR